MSAEKTVKEEPAKAKKEEPKAAKKEEKKDEKGKAVKKEEKKILKESIHTVNLSKAMEASQKKKRNAAITELKRYIIKHTRKKPKISEKLNAAIWEKSKPPRAVKIKIAEEEEFATADLQ
jgi:ribosomal protein L31E